MMIDTFYVRGRGDFPFDMLRYDSCWPCRGDDVDRIFPGGKYATPDDLNARRGLRTVKLCGVARNHFTAGRWASFGWSANEQDIWGDHKES
jgi:hypothetical protein